mgnify:CR=1 FL=1
MQVALRRCGQAPQGETEQPPAQAEEQPIHDDGIHRRLSQAGPAHALAGEEPARLDCPRTQAAGYRDQQATAGEPAHKTQALCAISTLLQTLDREGACRPGNPIGTQ